VPPEQVDLRIVLNCAAPTTTTTEPAGEPLARTGTDAWSLSMTGVWLAAIGVLMVALSRRMQLRHR
jgi:hypothetical protein